MANFGIKGTLEIPREHVILMDCFVYILGSTAGTRPLTYVGWTNDIDKRLARHNAGKGARSTRGRIWKLLYSERYETRSDAMSREWYLKRDRVFRRELVRTRLMA